MFKRTVTAALALAIVLSSLAFSSRSAFAQRDTTAAPGVWQSAILIQNVSTASADLSINFYDKTGTSVYTYPTTLAGGKSVTIVVPSAIPTLAAGQYSAVVSSTQKVIASVQTSSVSQVTGPWTAFAYEGVDSSNAAKDVFFPANYNSYYTFFSEFVIQNTDDTNSSGTVLTADFYDGTGKKINSAAVSLGTLAKSSTKTYATTDAVFASAGLPSGNAGLFGAVIHSASTPIAGIVNIWATTPTNKIASYNGATAGAQSLYAPSLSNNYFGFASALTIQNVSGTASATVQITYSNGVQENFTLAPYAAQAFFQPNNTKLPSGNTGGSFTATVTATGAPIIGVVSYSAPANLNNNAVIGSFASYNAPSVASAQVSIPNLLSNYYGYFTNVSVQNTGSTPTDITLTYENGLTWKQTNIAGNGVANFIHLAPNGTSLKNPLSGPQSVSAVASSSNNNLLVAVIQHNTILGVTGYTSAHTPSDYLQVFTATAK